MSLSSSQLLQKYIELGEFLSKSLGEDVEVAIHDISDLNHSAIAIFNSHVSGRQLGAPMTYYGLRIIREKLYKTQNYAVDTHNVLDSGKVLRSSTYFIKDEEGELIGTMCINVDVSRYAQLSRIFGRMAFGEELPGEDSPALAPPQNAKATFPSSVETMIEATIHEFTGGSDINVEDLRAEKKIEIVNRLSQKGMFMLKGTIKTVSQALGVAESTIYRYLSISNNNQH